ncbi:MAG TPA: hypothetical protein VMD59_10375, partial [Acidimicrobiales bacterium]|nr:hypothetical protein [Acidimicrobiales bacterium]
MRSAAPADLSPGDLTAALATPPPAAVSGELVAAVEVALPGAGQLAVTFLPGDPPRAGSLVLYRLDPAGRGAPRRPALHPGGAEAGQQAAARRPRPAPGAAAPDGTLVPGGIEVVLPTAGGGVRRRNVAALRLTPAGALGALADLEAAPAQLAGAAVWAAAL